MSTQPLDSILSGGGEAVSEQTQSTDDNNVTQASDGESLREQATEALSTEAHGDGQRMVPHQALHAERQKSRRYSEEVADFRKALTETNAAFERRMTQLVEAVTPRQAQPAPPDFFDNPEAATRFEVAQTVSPEFDRINQTLHAFAKDNAVSRHSEDKVNEAEQAFIGALQSGRLDPSDYRRVLNSPNRKPIQRASLKRLPIARPPREEYLTPNMNAKELPDRIGFLHQFASEDDWDDDEDIPDEV